MEQKMFCYQCQETAGCKGCTMSGVCGKKPDVAAMQDLLVYVTKGISAITTALRQEGKQVSAKINHLITLNLFTTITNANFDKESMKEGIAFAHERGVRVHVTANILAHNRDLEGAREYFKELDVIKPDAVIISDPGMFTIAKEVLPDTDIHISTQANNTNYMTYNFWWNQGAKRVVSARELSLEEIKEIRAHIPDEMEIETFMHGAMCISYSGRCLLSSFLAGRDANRGACTHPCRWKYAVVEENRPGQYMPVYENERGTYIFNSKDLCMIEHIPEMVSSGIDSFKIEGRMKTALYVATVARTYRLAIDDFIEDPEKYKARIPFYKSEISKCTYRQYTTGFFFGKPDENTQIYDSNTYIREYTYLGIVGDTNEQGLYHIEQRNKFSVGETIEVMKPDGQNIEVTVKRIVDENGIAGSLMFFRRWELRFFTAFPRLIMQGLIF